MVLLQSAVLTLVLSGAPAGGPVLLDFYADWCGPCQQMDPIVRQMIANGYPIQRINFDQHRDLAARLGVDHLPSFVMVVDGKVVARQVGATSAGQLAAMCKLGQASRGPIALKQDPPVTLPLVQTSATIARGAEVVEAVARSEPARAISDRDLVWASVRLRIEDATGSSCGTGTIVDARQGEALILTCGHIFRDSQEKGRTTAEGAKRRIAVDLFGPVPAENIPGRLISFDENRDVGLLCIRVPGPVTVVHVAPPGYRIKLGERVVNVGCNNGESPTARHAAVASLDRYQGPPNIEVTGQPLPGRSGGGLFTESGLLVGICYAADRDDNQGLYAALASIHEELDRVRLAYVYRPGVEGPAESSLAAVDPPAMPRRMPQPGELVPLTHNAAPAGASLGHNQRATLSDEERDALVEIGRRKAEGAELILVIRPANPQQRSEVLVLDRPSREFMQQLTQEARNDSLPQKTSLDSGGHRAAGVLATPSVPAARPSPPAALDDLDALAQPLVKVLQSPPGGLPR
jgi:thiol-disulfide isomerase/thioredoxin